MPPQQVPRLTVVKHLRVNNQQKAPLQLQLLSQMVLWMTHKVFLNLYSTKRQRYDTLWHLHFISKLFIPNSLKQRIGRPWSDQIWIFFQAIVWGMQSRAVQGMLDFDYSCSRDTPSVVCMVYPMVWVIYKSWFTNVLLRVMYFWVRFLCISLHYPLISVFW